MRFAHRRPAVVGGVAVILLAIFLQVFQMARTNSPSYDEPLQIHAGYIQWKHGYVLLNPPLITRLMALPVLGMGLTEPPIPKLPYEPLGFRAGKALVRRGSRAESRGRREPGEADRVAERTLTSPAPPARTSRRRIASSRATTNSR